MKRANIVIKRARDIRFIKDKILLIIKFNKLSLVVVIK
jgi:hypothetical protein